MPDISKLGSVSYSGFIEQLDSAINQILDQHHSGLSLYELIKALSKPPFLILDERPLSDPVTLFQTNFAVMNSLYRIRAVDPSKHLEISSLNVCKISTKILKNKKNAIIKHDPLADYYLDWANFDTTEADVETLIHSFWEGVLFMDFKKEDLATLGAKDATTITEVKRCYRQKIQEHHPDKGGDPEYFLEVQTAFERLSKAARSCS